MMMPGLTGLREAAQRYHRSGLRPTAIVIAGAGLALLALGAGEGRAHGLVERYRLPIPLGLYLAGAGAVVALSFAATVPVRRAFGPGHHPRLDLLPGPIGDRPAHRLVAVAGRLAAVALLVLVVAAGLLGRQSPFHNIAPVLVWVVFWVGLSFASAVVGDVWALVNPWAATFGWLERAVRAARGRPLGPLRRWPGRLGAWPAAALLLGFAWLELVWPARDHPRSLALAVAGYSVLTWAGMLVFGRPAWLRGGEVFSAVFGLLARSAPVELRVAGRAACPACTSPACAGPAGRPAGDCAGCPECFARAVPADRRLSLRPPAVGLLAGRPAAASELALVVLLLAIVSFDGFSETPAWAALESALASGPAPGPGGAAAAPRWPALTLGLLAAPLVFLALFRATAWLMAAAAGGPGLRAAGAGEMGRRFVATLLPIAVAYHLAHYLPFLLVAGQLVIPLASDPFGAGWDLLGTALYRVDVTVMSAAAIWYTAVGAVVAGHVAAVWLAHVTALQAFGDPGRARRSQYPLVALMVGYTMLSLWILAQPVVE